ncbi:MAG TPA: hypothetical protein VGB14_01995 [Acidimicrobiales bacterium]
MTDLRQAPAVEERPQPAPVAADHRRAGIRHFERTSLHVLVNTVVTGGLGTLFWIVAARIYPAADVGSAVAAASLLLLLAFLAQLNLSTSISRFLPGGGPSQRAIVRDSYGLALVAAAGLGVVVLLVAAARGGALVEGSGWGLSVALALAIPVWVVFALQDVVLIALRRSAWVPGENVATTVAKFLVLPVLLALGSTGILVAWTLPALVAVPIVNRVVFRRFLRPGNAPVQDRQAMLGYALRDLPGAALWFVALRLVPVIVLEWRGQVDAAYIGLPWTILAVAALALPALSRALLAELSQEGADSAALVRHSTRLVVRLMLPACAVAGVLAWPVLGLAGGDYAARGAGVLAWGAVGLVPGALLESRLAVLRFHDRVVLASAVQAARAVLLLGSVVALVAAGGTEHIGLAFLLVNLAVAAVAVPAWRPRYRGAHLRGRTVVARSAIGALRAGAGLAPLAVGTALAAVGVAGADASRIGAAGLVQAVPPVWFAGTGLVVAGAVLWAGDRRANRWAVAAHVVVLAVLLHGLPGMVESEPRFPVAWLHAGFIDQIAADGRLLPLVDARFSWAGFFAGNALVERAAGTVDAMWLIRWWPVAVNLIACWAVYVIGGLIGFARRQRLLALPLMLVVNWAGQDYFSPQATAYVLYFVICAVVLAVFAGQGAAPGSRLARLLRPAPLHGLAVPPPTRRLVYLGCLFVAAALVVGHQLTPSFLASATLLLALTSTTRLRTYPFIVAIGTVGWLAYAATSYWVGHFSTLAGSVGQVSTLVEGNIGERAATDDRARQFVVASRIGLAMAIWGLAALALLLARRRGRTPVAAACLLVAPFPMFLLQPYGGEMLVRVWFFTTPVAALLVAGLAVTRSGRGERWRRVVAAGALAALLPVFLLARYGNERFEQVTADDATLVERMYDEVPDGSVVYVANRQTVVLSERVGEVRFRSLTSEDPKHVVKELPLTSPDDLTFLMATEGQEAYGEQVQGRPRGWLTRLVDDLVATGAFEVDQRAGGSVLLRMTADGQ